jgi:hypothetical protein
VTPVMYKLLPPAIEQDDAPIIARPVPQAS